MENNVKQATNEIKYKFYVTEKQIPWLIHRNNIVPEIDIPDSWFNFVQLPTTKQFDFDDMTTATIVVGKDTYTYWKVERYINNVKDKTYYFYTDTVLKLLRNAFHIELKLDVYMTYTRHILKENVLNNYEYIKINRGSISKSMLLDREMRKTLLDNIRNIDNNVLNGADVYSNIQLFRFSDVDENGKSLNQFPIKTSKISLNYNKAAIGYLNQDSILNYASFRHDIKPNVHENFTKGGIQYFDTKSKSYKLICNYNWLVYKNNVGNWAFTDAERADVIRNYMKMFELVDINPIDNVEYQQNVMNGYYAVFRNLLGDIDCYPILGKFNADVNVPFWPKSKGLTSEISFPTANESNEVVTSKYLWNRVYWEPGLHSVTFKMNNDWDSIYNDLVKNIVNTDVYSNKSFIGIYRGVVPTGKHNNICFDIEPRNYQTGNVRFGNMESVVGEWNIPRRLFYRISYNDFFTFTFGNDELISGFKKFALDKNATNDLINDSFIELLQPISIGTTEIIPARYIFNIDNNELKYTIPFTGTFLDSFQLFLRNGMYNHASYSISLGSTLPTKNEDYENQIKIIEQQKNAGVYSSIGNMIARPISWLGGFNFSRSWETILGTDKRGYAEAYNNYQIAKYTGHKTGRKPNQSDFHFSEYRHDIGSSYSLGNISNAGGFIGDAINIDFTIRQSETAKRNVGPGYLTSMTEDLLNAVVHYDNVLDVTDYEKNFINKGWFGIGFKKIFNQSTKMSYKFHYDNFGFPIDSFVHKDYFKHLYNTLKTGDSKTTIYVSFDNDWLNTTLDNLTVYNDNLVKSLIVGQLSSGIRMKKFS